MTHATMKNNRSEMLQCLLWETTCKAQGKWPTSQVVSHNRSHCSTVFQVRLVSMKKNIFEEPVSHSKSASIAGQSPIKVVSHGRCICITKLRTAFKREKLCRGDFKFFETCSQGISKHSNNYCHQVL